MPQVLIIDDDAGARDYVRTLAPPDWTVREAADGLSGLDAVRHSLDTLDLVILDLQLPDMDGRWVCAQIREVSPWIPILPFTGVARSAALLREFGCLPAVIKPVHPAHLAQALASALQQPAPALAVHPALEYLREYSHTVVGAARKQVAGRRVAVYATNELVRSGLARLLWAVTQTVELGDVGTLRRQFAATRCAALIVDAVDYPVVQPFVRAYQVPTIVVATARQRSFVDDSDALVAVLDSSAPAFGDRVREAVQAVLDGARPAAALEQRPLPGQWVPVRIKQRFAGTPLTKRWLEVLWLDYQGLELAEIAATLTVDDKTVTTYWKRLQRALHVNRDGAKAWFRARLDDA